MTEQDNDDWLKAFYPLNKERWIRVKYTDPKKAMKVIRFNSAHFTNDPELGFEVTTIGVRDDYTPQIEALLSLKKDMDYLNLLGGEQGTICDMIDEKIQTLLNEVLINS